MKSTTSTKVSSIIRRVLHYRSSECNTYSYVYILIYMYRCTKCIYRTVITFKEYLIKCKAVYNINERNIKAYESISICSSSKVLIEHNELDLGWNIT